MRTLPRMALDVDVDTKALAYAEVEKPRAVLARDLAASLKIENHAAYEAAGGLLVEIKREWKRLDDKRKEWTGPLVNVQRSINGAFRGPLEALASAEHALKSAMATFDQRMAAARVEAVTVTPGASPVPYMPEAEGVSIRYRRAFRVVDADRVPRQFCSPDESKIKEHIRNGGLEAIAGVEFFDEPIVSARVGK